MPVPTLVSQLSTTANSNSPSGADAPSVLDDHQRAAYSFIALHRDGAGFSPEAAVASASTADIGAASSFYVQITGTTTITSFGTNYNGPRFVRFGGALILTHNATTLILPTGASITTAAGDSAIFVPKGSPSDGWECVVYQRATGRALVDTDFLNTTRIDVASAATVNLTSSAPNTRNINITGTTTITAFTVAIGQTYFVRFNAALTLTNNANIVTQTGANIVTAAGDTCIIRATAANVVEVLSYVGTATTTQRGNLEISTDAEAQAGSGSTAIVASNLNATVLGMGQTAQNVVSSRAFATNYTNTTGRTIYVSVTAIGSSSADIYMQLLTGGTQRARCSLSYQETGTWRFLYNSISWPVLAGEVYRVDVVGGSATLSLWSEIRT